ncbi:MULTISPECIES: hypothetical protein [unclassified Variovorax]|uniref:hypothetical protein n=1 Tax=unclassified Variovorax TaxID=663243 RepID=UPI0032E73BE6
MRLMRKRVKESGAHILEHSTVYGATGVNRQSSDTWGGEGRRGCYRHRRLRFPEARAGQQRAHW